MKPDFSNEIVPLETALKENAELIADLQRELQSTTHKRNILFILEPKSKKLEPLRQEISDLEYKLSMATSVRPELESRLAQMYSERKTALEIARRSAIELHSARINDATVELRAAIQAMLKKVNDVFDVVNEAATEAEVNFVPENIQRDWLNSAILFECGNDERLFKTMVYSRPRDVISLIPEAFKARGYDRQHQ